MTLDRRITGREPLKDENKENASALRTRTPRKAPAARDKLKPLAMPKALKI